MAEVSDQNEQTLDELRAIAAHVAPQLRLGAGTPVKSPFSVPAPDGMSLAATVTNRASDNGQDFPVSFGVGFNTLGRVDATHPFAGGGYANSYSLSISADFFGSGDDRPTGAKAYPEDLGHPAYQVTIEDGSGTKKDTLLVYDVDGLQFAILPVDVPGTSTEKLGVAADVFRSVTV